MFHNDIRYRYVCQYMMIPCAQVWYIIPPHKASTFEILMATTHGLTLETMRVLLRTKSVFPPLSVSDMKAVCASRIVQKAGQIIITAPVSFLPIILNNSREFGLTAHISNSLAVYDLSLYCFGRDLRITGHCRPDLASPKQPISSLILIHAIC